MIARIARALVALLAVLVGAAGIYAVGLRNDHDHAPITLLASPTGLAFGSYQPGQWKNTVFILVLGSDERAGLAGARTDAIHVIGLNPGLGRATIIDIPRDTWVDIPGHGQERINTAYGIGGIPLTVATVGQLVGAPISYTMLTTFDGFEGLIDGIGGVNVDIPYHMDDPNSGAAFDPGLQRINGAQALAFSRDRHIPDGDIARTGHQGQLLIHALTDLRAKGTTFTDSIHDLDVLYRNVRTAGISPTDLFRLAQAALAIKPENVRNYTMPASVGFKGPASV
ncbi:MAG TPA: LCP family protein, partial [Mycobacteriales bacterium]|nr:LCP family protein [Mycobacteriales bacterium]